MNSIESFDLDRYMNLSGNALWDYVYRRHETLALVQVEGILGIIDSMDEAHLAGIIEKGCDMAPDGFALHFARYIAHPSQSVRLTTSRFFRHVPTVTKEVFDAFQHYGKQCREEEIIADLLPILAKKIQ